MSRLPTGMYQSGNSFLHRMSPLAKLLGLLILLAAAVATDSIPGYLLWIAFLGLLVWTAKIPMSTALASAERLKWFFLLVFLMNLCFFAPENPWFSFWVCKPSYEGMMQGINVVARVFLMLVISNVLTVTTAPLALTDGMEKLLSPLKFFRVPTEQTAMILSVAIQFIPTFFEETDMIRKAQTARGARFDSRRLRDKAAAAAPLAVPIFLSAFKRADELSLAMEARGYRTDARRSGGKKEKFGTEDICALLGCALLCAVQIVVL